mgnify:CR=1 FL=1
MTKFRCSPLAHRRRGPRCPAAPARTCGHRETSDGGRALPATGSQREQDLLVGVALSGGPVVARRSSASYPALEALAELRAADGALGPRKVSHLSSVSEGSLAASFTTHPQKPGREVAILKPDGSLSDAYRTAASPSTEPTLGQDFERRP